MTTNAKKYREKISGKLTLGTTMRAISPEQFVALAIQNSLDQAGIHMVVTIKAT